MELYLVRHGEMTGDPHAYYQPPVHGCLSTDGCQQAQALGQALADVPLTAVYASPLGRSIQTAQALAQERNLPIGIREWLVEWRPATVTGECPDPAQYEAMMKSASELRPERCWKTPAGEGCMEMWARIVPGFLRLLEEHGMEAGHGGYLLPDGDQQKIAIVAHGGSLGVLAAFLMGVPARPFAPFSFEFTGVLAVTFIKRADVWYPAMRVGALQGKQS